MAATFNLVAPHGLRSLVESLPSAEAKNGFSQLLERVSRTAKPVVITRNARPTAVVLSIEAYEKLVAAEPDALEPLRQRFDAMVAQMQTPVAHGAVDQLFAATTAELGEAWAEAQR
jgi:prevent-host-death family protein